jgi:aryl-alcohol dehydrogenase-like predicted oxidoreductase
MYNLINRDVEREVLPACKDQGMGFTSWSPLGGGMLIGKYQKAEKPTQGTRFFFRSEIDGPRFWHERGFEMANKVVDLSEKFGISLVTLALSWILHDKRVTSIITGVKTMDQLEENLIVGDWDLPQEIWDEVNRETAYDLGHLSQFSNLVYRSTFGEEET